MAQFDAYHQWLGISPGTVKPTYYELLGILPENADRDSIRRRALERVRQLHGVDAGPNEFLRAELVKRVRRAEKTLLDPLQRAAYDARLKAQNAALAAGVPAPTPTDSMDGCLQWGSTAAPGADLDSLAPLLPPGLYPAVATNAAFSGPMPLPESSAPLLPPAAPVAPVGPVSIAQSGQPPTLPLPGRLRSRRPASRAQRALTRGRRSGNSWGMLLLGAMSIAAVFCTLYAVLSPRPAGSGGSSTKTDSVVQADPELRRILTGDHEAAPASPPVAPSAVSPDDTRKKRPAALRPGDGSPKPSMDEAGGGPLNPSSETPLQSASDSPSDGPDSTSRPGSPAQLSQQELLRLQTLLQQGSAALHAYDFSGHQQLIAKALEAAGATELRGLVHRQQLLAQHLKRFHELLLSELRSVPAGTVFSLSNTTQFGLVEVRHDEIVLRVQGANRRYSLTPLPRGVGLGLAESILDNSPGSQVLIGAFLAAHPDRDADDAEQARSRWRQAAAAGLDLDDLPLVLDDDYELVR